MVAGCENRLLSGYGSIQISTAPLGDEDALSAALMTRKFRVPLFGNELSSLKDKRTTWPPACPVATSVYCVPPLKVVESVKTGVVTPGDSNPSNVTFPAGMAV